MSTDSKNGGGAYSPSLSDGSAGSPPTHLQGYPPSSLPVAATEAYASQPGYGSERVGGYSPGMMAMAGGMPGMMAPPGYMPMGAAAMGGGGGGESGGSGFKLFVGMIPYATPRNSGAQFGAIVAAPVLLTSPPLASTGTRRARPSFTSSSRSSALWSRSS